MLHSTFIYSLFSAGALAALTESNLQTHVGALTLSEKFNPVKEAYWTGYPHHRRTPFAVSPDGQSAYLAYLDSSDTNVHIQQVNPSTFASVGDTVTVTGAKEAGGLVAHNDGFALLTNEALPSGTSNAPAGSTPVPVLYRYTSGKQTWKTWLGGPTVASSSGHAASPDLNGDLVYSETAKKYGAYFVVTAYDGSASGHFGDNIQYISDSGSIETITGATSDGFGCSHNTGIAFEAADAPPFASICAEDQGDIWLNTETQYMSGVKISNENVTNGASNEAMGGMSGSYSGLARMVDSDEYIFTWVSKGAKDLTTNDWLGSPYTHSVNRTANRNVAIARFSDKKTIIGEEATNTLGGSGDDQVNWITTGSADRSNAHVAAFDGSNALVTYEEIASPNCPLVGFACEGTFTGAYYQLVNNGVKVGDALKSTDVFVAGDMVTMSDGRVCWPYVDMDWSLEASAGQSTTTVSAISFACMSLDGSSANTTTSAAPSSSTAAVASSTAAALASSTGVEKVDVTSTTAPVASQASSAASLIPSSVVAAVPQSSESALPSFVIVTSGATTTPPATSATSLSSIVLVPISQETVVPTTTASTKSSSSFAATSSAVVQPSETLVPTSSAPLEEQPTTTTVSTKSSSTFATTTSVYSSSTVVQPSETLVPTSSAPQEEQPTSSSAPSASTTSTSLASVSTETAQIPSGTALPAVPSGSGSSFPNFPIPTGGRGNGHKGHHFGGAYSGSARPTGYGVFPQAFALDNAAARATGSFGRGYGRGGRPTGTYGSGAAQFTGAFGWQRPSGFAAGTKSGSTPRTLETRVRPTATGVSQ